MRTILFIFIAGLLSLPLSSQESDLSGFWSKTNFNLHGGALLGDSDPGWEVGFTSWYFPIENLGIGPSLAYSSYSQFLDEEILSFGLEGIMNWSILSSVNAFASLDLGYGIPLVNEANFGELSTRGGPYFHPHAGIIIPTPRNIAFQFSLGYLRQSWSYDWIDFGNSAIETDVVYNRYRLSFGIIF